MKSRSCFRTSMMIIVAVMYFMIITVLEKEWIESTRKIYFVSTSEKKAGKEQFDHENNLFANNQCPLCHTFIHLLFLSLQEKWRKPVYGLLKQLSYFIINAKPFCFFVVISKFLRRDICGTFPGDRKIFAQLFLKVFKVSLEERFLVWYYETLVNWRNIWIGKKR